MDVEMIPRTNIARLPKEWAERDGDRARWKRRWQDVKDFGMPGHPEIERRTDQHWIPYDSTLDFGIQVLSRSIWTAFVNLSTKWLRLVLENREHERDHQIKKWLQDVSSQTRRHFNLSNFGQKIYAVIRSSVGMAQGCLYFEEPRRERGKGSRFRFRSLHVGEYVFELDLDDYMNRIWWCYPMRALNVVEKWPRARGIEQVARKLEKNDWVDLLHYGGPKQAGDPVGDKRNESISVVILKDQKDDAGEPIVLNMNDDGSYEGWVEFPFFDFPWQRESGDYGWSPAMSALPDTKTLDRWLDIKQEVWPLIANPPKLWKKNNFEAIIGGKSNHLEPGVAVIVRDMDGVRPMEMGSDIGVGELEEERVTKQIRDRFFVDQILVEPDRPEMTATEFVQRQRHMFNLLGAEADTFAKRMDRIVNRGFQILNRAGELPLPPDSLKPEEIRLKYESPMMRAQKLDELQGMQIFEQQIAQVAVVEPRVLLAVNWYEHARKLAELTGYFEELLLSRDQFEKEVQRREEAQQAMAEAQIANEGASAAQRLARAQKG